MSGTNLIRALININHKPNQFLRSHDSTDSKNSVSKTGKALELYVQDMFCDVSFDSDKETREQAYKTHLSWFGRGDNPPDFMIKEGDAVEVKKLESRSTGIQLNSSFPKDKLHNDDPRITKECRKCEDEDWESKDHLYAIGYVKKGKNIVDTITFTYGDCIAADRNFYTGIMEHLGDVLDKHANRPASASDEISRFNNVDPAKTTNLRVRGLWVMKNPAKQFDALMSKTKYNSFPAEDREELISLDGVAVEEKQIPSPNEPELQMEAVHISCSLQV
jgi:hypothetical protein